MFRCLMFNLSGTCELLFLLCFIASWTRVVVSVMLCPCICLCCSVNVSVCLICCVLDSVCELFGECLLNVMDVFSVGGGALLDRSCMVFHIMCGLCL